MRRVGIVNRGEPAVRFLDALAQLRHEDPSAPDGVALYVDADARSLYVRRAAAAIRLGPDRRSYLDAAAVVRALRRGDCDAAWLGWGFAAEDAAFAATLEAAGVTLIGPRAETMAALGDKIRAKRVAEAHGVPVAPWAAVDTPAQAREAATRIGYPLLIKAAAGGGGRGIRRVDRPEDLAAAIEAARDEATRAFAAGGILLERLVPRARHVEVQILGDGAGAVVAVGVRDCSVQRRRQKIIEECPSPGLSAAEAEALCAAAVRLGAALDYRSAGTVEFLWADDAACFLEVNTRLQVEHPITEAVYGIDLVRAQIDLARGGPLPVIGPPRGWAFEARICAEDPQNGFAPAPGRLARVDLPSGAGVRVDAGFAAGEQLSPEFDPLIAKVITWGPTRAAALARLARALDQTTLVVEGGQTNVAFLRQLLDAPAIRDGLADVSLLDRLEPEQPVGAAAAVVCAAVDRFLAQGDTAGAGADRHRVEVGRPIGVYRTGETCFRLVTPEGALTARYHEFDRLRVTLELDGRVHHLDRAPGDITYVVDGVPHRVAAATAGVVPSPSMAVVLSVPVEAGAIVEAQTTVVVLESMKMEVRVAAGSAGRLREICVRPGDQVSPGQTLAVVEAEAEATPAGPALPWERHPPPPERAGIRLHAAVIGWDIEPDRFEADLERLDGAGCLRLLNAFADVAELFEGRPRGELRSTGAMELVTPRLLLEVLRRQGPAGLSPRRRTRLRRALQHHGIEDLTPSARLAEALMRIERAGANRRSTVRAAVAAIHALEATPRRLLDRLAALDPDRFGPVVIAASRARYEQHERPAIERQARIGEVDDVEVLAALGRVPIDWARVAQAPLSALGGLANAAAGGWEVAAEAIARRLEGFEGVPRAEGAAGGAMVYRVGDGIEAVRICCAPASQAAAICADLSRRAPFARLTLVLTGAPAPEALAAELSSARQPWRELCLVQLGDPPRVHRVEGGSTRSRLPDVLPIQAHRFDLGRLANFSVRRLPGAGDVLLLLAEALHNPDDRRLLAFVEVRTLARGTGRRMQLPHVDRVFHAAVRAIEAARDAVDPQGRMQWNRLTLVVAPTLPFGQQMVRRYVARFAPAVARIGLEKVVLRARFAGPDRVAGPLMDLSIFNLDGQRLEFRFEAASVEPLRPRTIYESRVVAARRRGLAHPYEVIALLERGGRLPPGRFTEWDLDAEGRPRAVPERPPGLNTAGVVFGIIRSAPPRRPERLIRVLLLSDPTRRMGALAEPECRRVLAAFDLADELGVPVEWVAVSAGAGIDWDAGTENLDWTARVLGRIVRFTQAGGEVNVVVPGICVGAQAYWNAEATMMMHCRGLLVMTDRGSMVLTGKRALDASGCVSAEDDLALGGYAAIMGPNGQAQAHAPDLAAAYRLLYRYYGLTYVEPGRARPRVVSPRDRADRDVGAWPYPRALDHGFATVGQIFSASHNPDRKRPFAVRPVMEALVDRGHKAIERWAGWREAETTVVWEARVGGYAATLIGIDNQPSARLQASAGGPTSLAGGTLYPQSSRKLARALNVASGRRPVVVLANLSGFDGSPDSLARCQLEYGAEIGRAVTNFDGRIVFAVLSRYHGGAYVVFSKALNPGLTSVALQGSYASVIGGVPAAKVVFARDVRRETAARGGGEDAQAQVIAELAARFDAVHSVARAHRVGSIDAIIELPRLRPWIIRRLAEDHAASTTGLSSSP